jgi:hypothetical protein
VWPQLHIGTVIKRTEKKRVVLPLEMVDKSINPLQIHFKTVFSP